MWSALGGRGEVRLATRSTISKPSREVVHLPALCVHMPTAMRSAFDLAMVSGWCRKMQVKDEKRRVCASQNSCSRSLEFAEALQEMDF